MLLPGSRKGPCKRNAGSLHVIVFVVVSPLLQVQCYGKCPSILDTHELATWVYKHRMCMYWLRRDYVEIYT